MSNIISWVLINRYSMDSCIHLLLYVLIYSCSDLFLIFKNVVIVINFYYTSCKRIVCQRIMKLTPCFSWFLFLLFTLLIEENSFLSSWVLLCKGEVSGGKSIFKYYGSWYHSGFKSVCSSLRWLEYSWKNMKLLLLWWI